jgi:hypothetical protein
MQSPHFALCKCGQWLGHCLSRFRFLCTTVYALIYLHMHTHNHTHAPQVFIQPLPDHQAPLHALALCTSLMRTQLPLLLPQASCLDQTPNTHAYQAQQVCRTKGGLQASLWPHTSVTGRT